MPVNEGFVQQMAVGEDPRVELEVVHDVAVVEHVAGLVARSRFDVASVAQDAVAGRAEVVGPGVGAAAAVGAKALEVAGGE
jgi:hypothetical protein